MLDCRRFEIDASASACTHYPDTPCAAFCCYATPRPNGPSPGRKDRARVLIERGRKDAAKIGAYMAGHALIPDRVVLSPAARTQETWKYAATAFQPAPAAMSAERIYDATPHAILGGHQGHAGLRPYAAGRSATIPACTNSR